MIQVKTSNGRGVDDRLRAMLDGAGRRFSELVSSRVKLVCGECGRPLSSILNTMAPRIDRSKVYELTWPPPGEFNPCITQEDIASGEASAKLVQMVENLYASVPPGRISTFYTLPLPQGLDMCAAVGDDVTGAMFRVLRAFDIRETLYYTRIDTALEVTP